MVVRESANVTLTCKATGYPEPYVMWRREDGKDINYNGENGKSWSAQTFSANKQQGRSGTTQELLKLLEAEFLVAVNL
jgi:hypothetical protein